MGSKISPRSKHLLRQSKVDREQYAGIDTRHWNYFCIFLPGIPKSATASEQSFVHQFLYADIGSASSTIFRENDPYSICLLYLILPSTLRPVLDQDIPSSRIVFGFAFPALSFLIFLPLVIIVTSSTSTYPFHSAGRLLVSCHLNFAGRRYQHHSRWHHSSHFDISGSRNLFYRRQYSYGSLLQASSFICHLLLQPFS